MPCWSLRGNWAWKALEFNLKQGVGTLFLVYRLFIAGTSIHGHGPAAQRQHGRHHRAPEEAAAGPGGHRRRPPALVLLREAAHGQDAAAGHEDLEGLCHPGHRQPAASSSGHRQLRNPTQTK